MAIKKPLKHSHMSQQDLKVARIAFSNLSQDMKHKVMLICKVSKALNDLKQFDLLPLFLLFDYLHFPVF